MVSIDLQIAECLILLIKTMLKRVKPTNSYEENVKRLNIISGWAIIWAVGSAIHSASYDEFQAAIRTHMQHIFLPKTETPFDFFVHPDNCLSYVSWEARLQEFEFPREVEFHQISVPTIDTLKYKHMLDLLLE